MHSAFNLPPLEEFEDPKARQYYAKQPNPGDMSVMQSKAFYAVATGDNASFENMLKAGWPIGKLTDSAGKTVMHVAAQKGNPTAITAMLAADVPVDPMTRWKETPLHLAVRNNKLDCAKALLDAGASTTAVTYGGDTPAELAVKYKMTKIGELLSSKAAN